MVGLFLLTWISMKTAPLPFTVNFDAMKVGTVPDEFTVGGSVEKKPVQWAISADPSAPSRPNVLVKSGKANQAWAIKKFAPFKDGSIETKFHIREGSKEASVGVVFRMQDSENYYYAVAIPLTNSVGLFRMKNGKLAPILVEPITSPFKAWHKIKAEANEEDIRIYLDGKLEIELQDSSFTQSGPSGLFVTGEADCAFDDLILRVD